MMFIKPAIILIIMISFISPASSQENTSIWSSSYALEANGEYEKAAVHGITSCSEICHILIIFKASFIRLEWVRTAPFGFPVVPEV